MFWGPSRGRVKGDLWVGGSYQDRTVKAGVTIGRGLPGGGRGLFLK